MPKEKTIESYFKECSAGKLRELTIENERLRKELEEERKRNLQSTFVLFADRWRTKSASEKEEKISFDSYLDDPIHGQITIPSNLCHLLEHPLIKRLNYVKQLSYAFLKHKSAMHSRLSHSLGVAGLATRALQAILAKGVYYTQNSQKQIDWTEAEKQCMFVTTFLVGLLHDVGHGPFGHALDRYIAYRDPSNPMPKPDKHFTSQYLNKYFKDVMQQADINFERVYKILDPKQKRVLEGWDSFITDLVDSALDVDRMDYLVRDAHMTGLTVGSVNINALIERMVAFEEEGKIRLLYDITAIPYIENFLYARDIMFISCYENEEKLAAERILMRVVQELDQREHIRLEELMLLTDDDLNQILFYKIPPNPNYDNLISCLKLGRKFILVKQIPIAKTKSEKENVQISENAEIRSWLDARAKEEWTKALIEKPSEWENHLARYASVNSDKILVTVPSDESHPDKQIEARILMKENGKYCTKRITDESPILSELGEMLSRNRQVIRVFASPDLLPDQIKRIAEEFVKYLN